MENNIHLKALEHKAVVYEQSKMMRADSEVELDIEEGEVWIADYSESRGSAEFVEKVCSTNEVTSNEVIKLCEKHGWCYCI